MLLTRQEIFDNIESVKDEIREVRKELLLYKVPKLLDQDDTDAKICVKILAYLQDLEDELGTWQTELARRDKTCFGELQPCG